MNKEAVLNNIQLAQQGDETAKELIVKNNLGLVWSIVHRFKNNYYDKEDLFQIGCIGLMKAINNFDVHYGVQFSTYAVPIIMGEIKRYFRDDGTIKVSRSLKELNIKINKAKEILAHELTELVHGKDEADKAQEAARAIFSNKTNTDNMPSTTLTEADFADGEIGILDLMKKCGLIPSNGEGRRLIQQGGVSVDDEKVTDVYAKVAKSDFEKGYVVIKKGKKVYHKAILG